MDAAELQAVQATNDSLQDIEAKLAPLLALSDQHKQLEAQHVAFRKSSRNAEAPSPMDAAFVKERNNVTAAIALAISSLYFIRLRLQGVEVTKTHPVRVQLKSIQDVMKKLREAGFVSDSKTVAGEKRKAEESAKEKEEKEKEEIAASEAKKVKLQSHEKVVGGTKLSQPGKKKKKTGSKKKHPKP